MGKRRDVSGHGSEREWVGGRLSAPMYVTEGEPYRPDVLLWMELPEGLIVGSTLVHPDERGDTFGQSLLAALRSPMIGPPRRPDRIRVADTSLADEVRAALGEAVTVRVAPTPELDAVVHSLSEHIGDEGDEPASYFEGGRVSPAAVADLFRAASVLFPVAPWKVMSDDQVVRVDIPKLGVHGGCLCVIGALGESFGLVLFPSLAGWEAFVDANPGAHADGPIDLGTSYLSLNFERGADLAPTMRREVAEHGWPVAGPAAYPLVALRDRDGVMRPLSENDIRVMTACAISFGAFFLKHRRLFERGSGPPVCESYTGEDDLTVCFTAPYNADSLFEVDAPPPPSARPTARVGRNDPCPCGSGKKYKKCHLGADQTAQRPNPDESAHQRDARLVTDVLTWATRHAGRDWVQPLHDADARVLSELLLCWCVYHGTVDGRRVVDRFLEEQGPHLSADDRAWLASQQAAWLSIWEVSKCEPGVGLRLHDLLTGEIRSVHEVSGSKTLVKRDAVLARVVDHDGVSLICGMYPRALPPWEAAEVIRRVRARLRLKRAVPVERLRNEAIGRYMVDRWQEAVADLAQRARIPPSLTNTDGDELLLTTDHFVFDAGAHPEIEARLAAVDGVRQDESNGSERCFNFVRPGNARHNDWESTLIGRARVSDEKLALETNSVARADHLRRLVEERCGSLLRHRIREHTDPRAHVAFSAASDAPLPPEAPEAARLVREHKERHYRGWADEPLPGLSGQSPRQALRTATGRQRVDLLLKDMENRESRLPDDHRYDFSRLRRELGLDP